MKTLFVCLGIMLGAVLLGSYQHGRIVELEGIGMEDKAERNQRFTAGRDGKSERIPHGKSRLRPVPPAAPDVLETVIDLLVPRGAVSDGAFNVIDNREMFAAVMQLDLAGKKELIPLVADSKDPKFSENLYRCMVVDLCLSAMADRHPEEVLKFLNKPDELIGSFYGKQRFGMGMKHYAIQRLCEVDPAAGMETVVRMANRSPDEWGGHYVVSKLLAVLEIDPDLALHTIVKLPENLRQESWKTLVERTASGEESASVLRFLLKNPLADRRETVELLDQFLLGKRRYSDSWDEVAVWLDGMDLSEAERIAFAPALYSVENAGEGEEVAKWLLKSVPASQERNYLVWRATLPLRMTEPEEAEALFEKEGIDPEAMEELAREGYLRETF